MPGALNLMGLWINRKLFDTKSKLVQKEWATLSNLVRQAKSVDHSFNDVADVVNLVVIKPVVNNDGLVAIDGDGLFRLSRFLSTEGNRVLTH